ncbi:MAG: hypothetical protein JO154_00390, partial [Chitinophaga sp.]|uniref:Ig-like domain-containing protein n=1 Tax=Chitinophaga sp. TaxID=1869181 RepID=UPI0025BE8BDC
MKRFLTLIFLILSFLLVRTTSQAQVTTGVSGKAFMNLPDTVCAGNFASMNAFIWGSGYTNTNVTWTITGGGYTILYGSDGTNLINQAPDSYKMNALTLQFNTKNVNYTISALVTYSNGKTTTTQTITKKIYSKDCSMAQCFRSDPKLGASDFKEDFGTFPINAGPRPYSDPTATVYYPYNPSIYYSSSNPGNFGDNSYVIYWNTQARQEWMRVMDHTQNGIPGVSNGGMLVCNSAYEKIVFFEKTVKVCPGSRYNFSAWFINTNTRQVFNQTCNQGNSDGYHYAGVTFQIVSAKNPTQILSEFHTYDVSMNLDVNGRQWLQYGGTFKITTDDNAVILRIRNDNPGGCGNDIAIDDIQFNYCPPDIQGYVDGLIEDRVTESVQCAGAPLDLTANGDAIAAYFTKPVYRWEFSYDQTNWQPVSDSVGLNPVTGNIETIRSGSQGPVLHFSPGALTGDPLQPIIRYYRLRVYEYRADGVYSGDCGTPSSAITITILPKPIVKLSSSQICQGQSVNLTVAGQYTEYIWKEPADIAGRVDQAVVVTPLGDTKYTAWGVAKYGNGRACYDSGSAWIRVDTPAVVKVTGGPLAICMGNTPVNFQISPDNNKYAIKWTSTWPPTTIPVAGPGGDTTYASTTNQLNNIYPWHIGQNYFKATVTKGVCVTPDSLPVMVYSQPIAKTNASKMQQCNQSQFTMKATAPLADQTGQWSFLRGVSNGTSTITNPSSPTTTVNITPAGTTDTLIWRVTNNGKSDCVSTDTIILFNSKPLTTSINLPSTIVCANSGAIVDLQLNGTVPANPGETGKWTSSVPAMVTFDDDSKYNTTAHIVGQATTTNITLYWTISNGICTPNSQGSMTVRVKAPPTITITNTPVKACNTVPSVDLLIANSSTTISQYQIKTTGPNAMPGFASVTGAWNSSWVKLPLAIPANTAPGVYNFVLSVWENDGAGNAYAGCRKDVTFTVELSQPSTPPTGLTVSTASICDKGDVQLTINGGVLGTDPSGNVNATWKWYKGGCGTANGGTLVIPDVANADNSVVTFKNVTATTTYYVVAESTGSCGNSTCASTTITVYKSPIAATAGTDQKVCNQTTSFTLNGNTPAPTGATGTWTVLYGNATVITPNDPKSKVTVPVGDSSVFQWELSNGNCATTKATVTIVNYATPVQANAGANQKVCAQSTPFTLDGNPASPSTAIGRWTVVYGTANFGTSSINDPKAKISVAIGDSVVLRWTISNGNCATTSSDVSIVNYANPIQANANVDQRGCAQTTPFVLNGNTPAPASAIGRWTVTYGNATFNTSINNPNAQVTVAVGDSVVLRWTIINGNCAESFDEMSIVNYAQAVTANAGTNQKACAQATPFTLNANPATPSTAIGRWTVVYGTANFGTSSINDPKAQVTVAVGDSVVLRWTIVNGNCATTSADVSIVNFATAVTANAGANQKACAQTTPFIMNANAATPSTAIGRWTVTYGNATFSPSINDPKAKVTVAIGDSVVLRWTITNGVCADTYSEMSVVNFATAVAANAGANQKACAQTTPFTLDGNLVTPSTAIGRWTVTYGSANFGTSSINDPKAKVTVAVGDSVVLRWTITNGVCADTYSEMSIVNFATAVAANA